MKVQPSGPVGENLLRPSARMNPTHPHKKALLRYTGASLCEKQAKEAVFLLMKCHKRPKFAYGESDQNTPENRLSHRGNGEMVVSSHRMPPKG
jgi:hypothetical protein